MTTLNVDFSDVPDEYPQIGIGVYDAELVEIESKISGKALEDEEYKQVLHLKWKIVTECEFSGMCILDWLCTWTDMGKVDIKKMLTSMGVDLQDEIEFVDLIGKIGKINIVASTRADAQTGETLEGRSVKEYLVS